MEPSDAQQACFEAGIKFGSLYHQFAGTPVSLASAASLAHAMEEAIENQPHCESVTVDVQTEALADALEHSSAEYTELTGKFLEVQIVIAYGDRTVTTVMAMEDGYPLMGIESIE